MPLSAYLFVLALETLTTKIRSDKNIKGIEVDNKEINFILLADDITLLLHDLDSVKYSVSMLKSFQHSSGLKINIRKTQATYIGSLKDNDYYPHGLSWIRTPKYTNT